MIADPCLFDLALPPLPLEGGARLSGRTARGFLWGPADERAALARLGARVDVAAVTDPWRIVRREAGSAPGGPPPPGAGPDPAVPTVLVVHALTGDARAGGPGGWWNGVVGSGAALDPSRLRVLCFNLLGSCYGTTGPADADFPSRAADRPSPPGVPRAPWASDPRLPATITTWDQARTILDALDALGVGRVHLATGGSLGAMIVLALAALDPGRFERIAPIAGGERASPWVIGFNHVGRRAVLSDPGFPDGAGEGLALARALAMLTYRHEDGLTRNQGRRPGPPGSPPADGFAPDRPYAIQTYLDHQGDKLVARFDPRAYLALLDAMDHHDLDRPPPGVSGWPARGLDRIRASVFAIGIDSDVLFPPTQMTAIADALAARGRAVGRGEIRSPHGHDAFLIETDQVSALLSGALALPPGGGGAARRPSPLRVVPCPPPPASSA